MSDKLNLKNIPNVPNTSALVNMSNAENPRLSSSSTSNLRPGNSTNTYQQGIDSTPYPTTDSNPYSDTFSNPYLNSFSNELNMNSNLVPDDRYSQPIEPTRIDREIFAIPGPRLGGSRLQYDQPSARTEPVSSTSSISHLNGLMNSGPRNLDYGSSNQFASPSRLTRAEPIPGSDEYDYSGNVEDSDSDSMADDAEWEVPEPEFEYEGDIDDRAAFIYARNSRIRVDGGLNENFPGIMEDTRERALQIFNAFKQTRRVRDLPVREGIDGTAVARMKNGYWSDDLLWNASWKVVVSPPSSSTTD